MTNTTGSMTPVPEPPVTCRALCGFSLGGGVDVEPGDVVQIEGGRAAALAARGFVEVIEGGGK